MSDEIERIVKLYGTITGKRSLPKLKKVDKALPVPIAETNKPYLK